jgi:cytoskeletal protein CcmA (bactofilin family)
MKRLLVVFGIIVLSAAGVAAGTADAQSRFAVSEDNEKVTLAAEQTVDSSWYAAGTQINLKGTVNGDVYCGGQLITISGRVSGDVLCAGQQITLARGAVVEGSIRLAGQSVTLEDEVSVGGSASIFGQTVMIDEGAVIEKDLNGASQSLTLDGTIKRDMAYGLSQLNLNGQVGRDADLAVESVDFGGSGSVGRNLNYTSPQEESIPDEAIKGSTTWKEAETDTSTENAGAQFRAIGALSMIVFVVVVTLLLPRFISETAEANKFRPGRVLLAGMAAFGFIIILPIIGILMLISVIGILLVPIVFAAWLLFVMMLLPLFSYFIGRLLLGETIKNIILVSLFGAVVTLIALNLPLIGGLVGLAILLVGGGLAVLWFQDSYRRPSYMPDEVVKTTSKK